MKKQKGYEILIRGTVQGVGFRPFVYNLASRLQITGTVSNTGNGVHIRAAAQDERLSAFLEGLKNDAPPLARITSIEAVPLSTPPDCSDFTILASKGSEAAATSIQPDIALRRDCLAELLDPDDHRFQYPFINCTNCGPLFSIVEEIPYDRPKTSMKVFPMCDFCQSQYNDPTDRRFHAQPNACGDCGPQLSFHERRGAAVPCESPLAAAASALADDKVVAVRGLGGFHLSVNGYSQSAVQTLRSRKGRPDKPLAVMMPDLATVKKHCRVDDREEALLDSPIHPIVLLRMENHSRLAANLAPGLNELGVMLPYTPVHHMLFRQKNCPDVLVMTSGNVSGAPICTANEDALVRLASIADFFLLHNREIVTRVDDSVARIHSGRTQILRRARGYVPAPIDIPWRLVPTIGCGGGLKSTFCLGRELTAYPSQHIGDLFNLESLDFYAESVNHLQSMLQIKPEIAVCDLHPDYLSSHYAQDLGLPLYRVQHHHAHAVAVMAEHGLSDPVLAVILDGTGSGPDGTNWGGEFMLAGLTGYQRLAHFEQLRLPGGDAAAQEPWRMGISSLFAAAGGQAWPESDLPPALRTVPTEKRRIIQLMLENTFNTPLSSSCGRLFDAVASILGIRQTISYEGQGAIELESRARCAATSTWKHQINEFRLTEISPLLCQKGQKFEIYSSELVKMLVAALAKGTSPDEAALLFHYLLISSITELIRRLSDTTGIEQVVLAGGCMQNSLLLEGLSHALRKDNLQIFTGENLPVNDGALSLGQTIIGGLQHVSRDSHEGYEG